MSLQEAGVGIPMDHLKEIAGVQAKPDQTLDTGPFQPHSGSPREAGPFVLGFGIQSLGFWIQNLGFRFWGIRFMD